MWLFRKKDTSAMPDEVQEYYNQDRRERAWVAWALAIATMLVTIVLALGLFYGGRWIYRQLFSSNDETTTQTTDETKPAEAQEPTTQASTPPPAISSTNTNTPSAPQPTPQPATTPRTGPDSDE